MNIITALIECAKGPLTLGYVYGFIAIMVGAIAGVPALVGVGMLGMIGAVAGGGVMVLAQ